MDTGVLKELANDNITKIFDAFGFDYRDRYQYYQMTCPIHGGDNPSAFSWVKDGGYFRCFTRKCERGGADIFDFIRKYKRCDFQSAVEIVKSIIITETYAPEDEEELVSELKFQKYIKNSLKAKKDFTFFDPKLLDKLKKHDYLIKRGFPQKILDEFGIGFCDNPQSHYYNRICIPLIHHDGGIVGFTARAVDEDFKKRGEAKWVHTPNCPTGNMLFNLNKAKEHIRKTHTAVIVEGPLDVLRLWMAGIYNAVAILGSSLSGPQRSLLLQCECYDLVLGFDNDAAGKDCANKVVNECGAYFGIKQYKLPDTRDIGELSVEEIQNLDIIEV